MDDVEGSPEFQALVIAAAGKPEKVMGSSVIPAEPVQWNDVRRLAKELLSVAPTQLAVHVYSIQAETKLHGFPGFRGSLEALLELFVNRWDEIYPEADLEDSDDMYYARVNLISELTEQPLFLDAIYRLPLISVRGIGEFCTRDIDICMGSVVGDDDEQTRCQEGLIRGAFAETDTDTLTELADALVAIPETCQMIESVFIDKSGQKDALSMQRLSSLVESCHARFMEFAEEHLRNIINLEPSSGDEIAQLQGPDAVQSTEPVRIAKLTSRAMVGKAFDAIMRYYEINEPSSPVRILVYRASEFVDKSFFEILQALTLSSQDDLPALLAQVQKEPLATLLTDCYSRFLAGEKIPSVDKAAEPVAVFRSDTPEPAAESAPVVSEPAAESTPVDSDPITESSPDKPDAVAEANPDELDTDAQSEPVASAPAAEVNLVTNSSREIQSVGASIKSAQSMQGGSSDEGWNIMISSRRDVDGILCDIETYFLNAEPASPIPILTADLRKLVSKGFADLMAEFGRLLPVSPPQESQ